MRIDRVEDCFGKIQESIATMNHNSTTTASAMEKIATAVDSIEKVLSSHQTQTSLQHSEINNSLLNQQKFLLSIIKWVVVALIIIIAGVLGVNLKLPFGV